MANELTREQLHRLARLGAHARLEELAAERKAILRAFPGLSAQAARKSGNGDAAPAEGATAPAGAAAVPAKKRARRKKMSAEQRQALSERMRARWAERRKAAEA